jgi:hypothetical protein
MGWCGIAPCPWQAGEIVSRYPFPPTAPAETNELWLSVGQCSVSVSDPWQDVQLSVARHTKTVRSE